MSVVAVLHLAVGPAGELAEDDREENDEGHKAEHHQGQLVVQTEHRRQNAQNDESVLGQVDQQVGKHHGDGVGVVGHTGDQLAHRDLIELLVGKGLDVGKEVFAQVGDDALAHFLQDDGLQIGAGHREDAARPHRRPPRQTDGFERQNRPTTSSSI